MAGFIDLAVNVKNARLQAIADYVNANSDGTNPPLLRFYDGSKPAEPEVLITDQNLMITMECSYPIETTVVAAVMTLDTIAQGLALISGTTTWARMFDGAGGPVADFIVGATGDGTPIEITQVNLLPGVLVSLTSATIAEV